MKYLITVLFGLCVLALGCTHMVLTDANRHNVIIAQLLLKEDGLLIVHESEKGFLLDPQETFWNHYLARGRFNEESLAPTNRPWLPVDASSIEIVGVKDGDIIEREGSRIHILETPGLNPRGISYWYEHEEGQDEKRDIITGNLILEDGKIANIFDLQDRFPEADIGPYHGFMARAPALIASLEKIRAVKPDTLRSNSGIIENPDQAIDNLIARLRAVYRNYLSTSALWWYFGERRMNASAVAILGDDFDPATLDRMPQAELFDNPDWLIGFSTTRMIKSETGNVFVMDVNCNNIAQRIIEMHTNGEFANVDGMFITHYHHDHNAGVPKVAEFFSAPVYGVEPLADILERPGAYRMPCLENIVVPIVRKNDGETMQWHEFEFTFFDFPGQTLYHNALLVRRKTDGGDERPILFIGDSFTPTGIDDYCAWNRNLLKDGKGYLYCLELIRSLDPLPLLVNAHVDPPFELDAARLDYIERALRERMILLADLLAVPEINFGLDHAWCRFDPFVQAVQPGESAVLTMVITNHFDEPTYFHIELEPDVVFPFDISPLPQQTIKVAPGEEGTFQWTLTPKPDIAVDVGFVSAMVAVLSDDYKTPELLLIGHCEAVVKIE